MIMVREEKIRQVDEIKKRISEYSTIGIIDMHKLPSRQIQEIKKKLRGKAEMKMTKKSVLLHAIKGSDKKGLQMIEEIIPKQPAVIFTDLEPLKFYAMVERMKSFASAKEGDVAPDDIIVHAGPTNLLAGPAISEFTKVGIPVGVEEGKIAVKRDTVVAKKGASISKQLAGILRKLNIEPILVGLNIVAIYSNGEIFKKNVLALVGDFFISRLKEAYNQALNLSVYISYPTKENIWYLLSKAVVQAKAIENKIGNKMEVK